MIEIDDYVQEDPYDTYMDSLTQRNRNKALKPVREPKEKKRWGWKILWGLTLPKSLIFWPLPQYLWKEVKRLFKKPRV